MPTPRFSIGIDLGTTNCALAFVPLDGEAKSEILGLPQWETLSGITESSALPSFLYLPDEAVADQIKGGAATKEEWIVGRLARKKAGETPGRVVHSAKILALPPHVRPHGAVSALGTGNDIARTSKISPLRASALILSHLKGAWNSRFAHGGPDFEFDSQEITVTVPASFDAAAQRLTLMAAQEAGFPEAIRLLEEPQAALYSWLEQHNFASDWVSKLPRDNNGMHHVLVVDIGGGTSDFSLFEFHSPKPQLCPRNQAAGSR